MWDFLRYQLVISFLFRCLLFEWCRQIFLLISNHLNLYQTSLCGEERDKEEKISEKDKKSQKLSFLYLINMPALSVLLSKKNDLKSNKSQQKTQNFIGKWNIRLISFILTAIVCLFIPILLSKQYQSLILFIWSNSRQAFNRISSKFFLMQTSTFSTEKVIFLDQTSVQVDFYQLIGNVIYLTLLLKKINTKFDSSNYSSRAKQVSALVLKLAMILINPYFISIYLLDTLIQHLYRSESQGVFNDKSETSQKVDKQIQNKNQNQSIFLVIKHSTILLFVSCVVWYSIYNPNSTIRQYYEKLLFPQLFQPRANLMWIFYSHMFHRYLTMYQCTFFLITISTAIPLSLLNINYQTKVLIQYFVISFTSYHSSSMQLYLFWLTVLLCLPNFNAYQNLLLQTINKTLGLVAFVGSTFFFFVYQKMLAMYLNNWMVNIGYPFLFGCVAWTLIAIWLAQLIRIELQEVGKIAYQSQEKGKLSKIADKFKEIVKNKLWTKIDR